MKRKFLFASIATFAIVGGLSCWTVAQNVAQNPSSSGATDPFGATAGQTIPAVNVYRNENLLQRIDSTNNFGTSGSMSVSPQSFAAQAGVSPQIANVQGNENHIIRSIVERYSAAQDASSKEQSTAELKQLLDKQFDFLQDAKSVELKKLEEQLAKLKELHSKRAKQKEQIVSDRVQQILREADGLGWGTSDNGGSGGWLTTSYSRIAPNAPSQLRSSTFAAPSVPTFTIPARPTEPAVNPLAPAAPAR
jgi:hypothetical protein